MLVVGCGDLQESSGGSSNSSDGTQILSSSAQGTQTGVLTERPWTDEPPARLTDVNGWVWNRQHKIEYDYRSYAEVWGDVNDEYIDTRKIDPEPTPSDATDYDYGYYYRPIADIAGWEYHLSEESILEFGAYLRRRAIDRLGNRTDIPDLYQGASADPRGSGAGYRPDRDQLRALERSSPLSSPFQIVAKVIGTDDRIAINAWAGVFPFSVHGDMGDDSCTAFKAVNRYSAATAAHCVHHGSKGGGNRVVLFSSRQD